MQVTPQEVHHPRHHENGQRLAGNVGLPDMWVLVPWHHVQDHGCGEVVGKLCENSKSLGHCGVILQFVITNSPLWLLTLSRFQGFQLHIPFFPHEKHIEEFHSILDGFQSSSRGDFSLFRIKADEMNAPVPEITGLEPVMKDYKYCDSSILKARVSGAVRYVMMVTSIHSGKTPSSDRKEPEKPIPSAG